MLAGMLERYRGSEALVLAIPSGGVPVAAEIAKSLGLTLDVVPVSKVLLPWTTESGYGAVAFDGSVWIDDEARSRWNLTREQMDQGINEARVKVARRNFRLRGGRALPAVADRPVILVDDGIAAGSTMRTAIAALRKLKPSEIVVAVPTAHREALDAIARLADQVCCANVRGGFSFAVADAYEIWRDLSEDEVAAVLGI
ncbi:MAG: phosphoribosyltransferase [Betaproteobacteria bacterium]|nr:phosphoribosyltransferase [Betaproteobacteria bacterium]